MSDIKSNGLFCTDCGEYKTNDEISRAGRPTCQDCGSIIDTEGSR